MKASAIFTAITFLAAGVIAAPSAEGDALIKRADTCFDCQFNSFVSGRCKGACTGAEEAWGNGGQNCKHCIALRPPPATRPAPLLATLARYSWRKPIGDEWLRVKQEMGKGTADSWSIFGTLKHLEIPKEQ
uniref:Uncharacterized protein n=1 Tax=Colletotrichum fructicola (strain Nara gc5) TaxID=1213859 RepID=L2G6Z4_COLFN